jgi:hypothetical protein
MLSARRELRKSTGSEILGIPVMASLKRMILIALSPKTSAVP